MTTDVSASADLRRLMVSSGRTTDKIVFVGFDGFVDKIKTAAKEKQNAATIYFDSIRELGMAASGSYVENSLAPDRRQIIEYLDVWMRDITMSNQGEKAAFAAA